MFSHGMPRRWLQVTVACTVLVSSGALAQDRKLVTWTGSVDKEAQITILDTTISTGINGGRPVTMTYFNAQDRLPKQDGFVRVELRTGRGDVDVIQQPSATNGYAAIVRIRDKSAGKDEYEFTAFWNPARGEDRYSTAAASARAKAAPPPAKTMQWSGDIDRDMLIEWHGLRVKSLNQSGATPRAVHSRVSDALPDRDAQMVLVVREGRGDVGIEQPPSKANGYTAIFRVRDPHSGFGHYDFDATWR